MTSSESSPTDVSSYSRRISIKVSRRTSRRISFATELKRTIQDLPRLVKESECRWFIIAIVVAQTLALFAFGELSNNGQMATTACLLSKAVLLTVFAWFAQAFCGLINDIHDIENDKINAPHRPLPSGKVSSFQAWVVATFYFVSLVIIGCILASSPCSLVALFVHLCCSIAYSLPRLDLSSHYLGGPLAMGTGTGSWYFLVLSLSGNFQLAWLVGSTFFFQHMLVTPLKDVGDLAGDIAAGRRTLAVVCPGWVVQAIGMVGFILPWVSLSYRAQHQSEDIATHVLDVTCALLAVSGLFMATVLLLRPDFLKIRTLALLLELGQNLTFSLLLPFTWVLVNGM